MIGVLKYMIDLSSDNFNIDPMKVAVPVKINNNEQNETI
jgi:hypothetical protein